MIAIGLNHPISFFVEPLLHGRVGTDLVPHSRFRLEVEADLIGSLERRVRWAPGMKAHMVETPLLTNLKQRQPRFDVSGWITRQGKISAAMCAPKIDGTAVEDELIALRMKVAQAHREIFVFFNVGAFEP